MLLTLKRQGLTGSPDITGMCPPQKGLWDCTHLPLSVPVQHVNHVLQHFLTVMRHHPPPSSKDKPLRSP